MQRGINQLQVHGCEERRDSSLIMKAIQSYMTVQHEHNEC